jgi:hypothetical protein
LFPINPPLNIFEATKMFTEFRNSA